MRCPVEVRRRRSVPVLVSVVLLAGCGPQVASPEEVRAELVPMLTETFESFGLEPEFRETPFSCPLRFSLGGGGPESMDVVAFGEPAEPWMLEGLADRWGVEPAPRVLAERDGYAFMAQLVGDGLQVIGGPLCEH